MSFPHSPQVFPQGFSTGAEVCGYSFLVHIKRTVGFPEKAIFLGMVDFHQGIFFVQKLGLDTFPDEKSRDAAESRKSGTGQKISK